MTDRQYVESTVAYLTEHVPWMWHKLVDDWRQWHNDNGRSSHRVLVARVAQTMAWCQSGGSNLEYYADDFAAAWAQMRVHIDKRINPKHHPLVSADWWDERGEPKLAELLRRQEVARCKLTAEEVKAIRDEVAKDLEDYPND